ncbi:hypothetical protein [Brachybacterium alimentarium]|uniref:hypothetical protein n=1 Tax=Brachybacterium alimentarium TaxID=47845 RepID=UPI003FD0033D
MSTDPNDSTYPDFVSEDDRHAWDALSPEDKQTYRDAVPYIRETYPGEELSVIMIGTILSFGG